jgi:hypothetical protein
LRQAAQQLPLLAKLSLLTLFLVLTQTLKSFSPASSNLKILDTDRTHKASFTVMGTAHYRALRGNKAKKQHKKSQKP